MKIKYLFFLIINCMLFQLPAQSYGEFENASQRVIGGEIVEAEEYPWMVALLENSIFLGCGATLIHPDWVLTAAHCIDPGGPVADQVMINSVINDPTEIESYSELINIDEVFVHQGYISGNSGGGPDIALLKLAQSSDMDYVSLATMQDASLFAHEMPAQVLGWGKTVQGGQIVDSLRHTNCHFISGDNCEILYQATFPSFYARNPEGSICAGYSTGNIPKGAARGDSGGPLFFEDSNGISKQVGIVSGGELISRRISFQEYLL